MQKYFALCLTIWRSSAPIREPLTFSISRTLAKGRALRLLIALDVVGDQKNFHSWTGRSGRLHNCVIGVPYRGQKETLLYALEMGPDQLCKRSSCGTRRCLKIPTERDKDAPEGKKMCNPERPAAAKRAVMAPARPASEQSLKIGNLFLALFKCADRIARTIEEEPVRPRSNSGQPISSFNRCI